MNILFKFAIRFEANHNKDYSVVKTLTAVPPQAGLLFFILIDFDVFFALNSKHKIFNLILSVANLYFCPVISK